VDADGRAVFNRQKKFFEVFLSLVTQNAVDAARRNIQDPVALADRIDKINRQSQNLAKRPYFPFTRFGRHFVTVRNAAGDVVSFQTYERRGLRSAERVQEAAANEVRRSLPPGHKVEVGVLPETAIPFSGLPPALLDAIATDLQLTA